MINAQTTKNTGGKYTEGFTFHHDEAIDARVRKVVERSGAAVSALMQDVLVRTEKQILEGLQVEPLRAPADLDQQARALQALRAVVKARRFVERGVFSAMSCAFADLAHQTHGLPDNLDNIKHEASFFSEHLSEKFNLYELLNIREKIAHNTNSCRPLLVHLNAQLAVLMGVDLRHLTVCPLSPAVFLTGFLAGLHCTTADMATKKILLSHFEQSFLARLSILLNNITLRLEEEGILIQQAIGFEEFCGGPFESLLGEDSFVSESVLRERVEGIPFFDGAESIEDLSERLSNARILLVKSKMSQYRQILHKVETLSLCAARKQVFDTLNQHLLNKKLPDFLHLFLNVQWPDVLFDALLLHGAEGDFWQDLNHMLDSLLKSIELPSTDEQRKELSQSVPKLVRHLRETLEEFGYHYGDTASLFEGLKELHLQILQKKLDTAAWREWQPLFSERSMPPMEVIVDQAFAPSIERIAAVFT